jgi:signal transduction histidine kinase
MVLVGSGLSLLIIKNINDKLRVLVQTSSEIAAGNLDFDLNPRGNDQIAQLTRAFNDMRDQLKAEEVRRSQLLMSITHDLKTPLASIDGYIDALQEGFADDEETRQRFLGIMKDKSAVLTQRIASLINFAKLATKDARIDTVDLSLRDFVEDFIDVHQPEAELQGFVLESTLRLNRDIHVGFDPELLFRALENIFSNAIKFSDARKHIIISLIQTDKDIQLSFQNYGSGLHKEELAKVFEPFYRVSSGRNTAGTGLGLTSAKYIVESHGWQIYAVSVLKEMTRFTIAIPLQRVTQVS